MITLINVATDEQTLVTPTIFPDKTSQVWKLDINENDQYDIVWDYESEVELIHLIQIPYLVAIRSVIIPYLPYARQDKLVSNQSTWARVMVEQLLTNTFDACPIYSLDLHSPSGVIISVEPIALIATAIKESAATLIVFPDKGALARYKGLIGDMPYVTLSKTRNQLTGEITNLVIDPDNSDFEITARHKILMVDDLADYGGTFIKAAITLYNLLDVESLSLYITHFLNHSDIGRYSHAGIDHIYTSESLTRYRDNNDGHLIPRDYVTVLD